MRSATRPPPSRCSPASSPRAARSNVRLPPERSAPAQKARPAPVTITARTPSSRSARSSASISSSIIAVLTALSLSARSRTSVQTPPSTRLRTAISGPAGARGRSLLAGAVVGLAGLELAEHRLRVDAEDARDLGLVALGHAQRLLEQPLLDL